MNYYEWGREILAIDSPVIGVQHCFSVVAVSDNGSFVAPAMGTQACIVPKGDDTLPELPDYFVVENTAENFKRFWWEYRTTDTPEDLAGFIIRYTKSDLQDWASAAPLHDGVISEPPFEISALPAGAQTVLLKALDTTGNTSENVLSIVFDSTNRSVENVLVTKSFAPDWEGIGISGTWDLSIPGRLSSDPSTTDLMWSADDTSLMYGDASDLMWVSPADSFRWVESVDAPAGILSLSWEGGGDIRLSYYAATFPDDFTSVLDGDNPVWPLSGDPFDLTNATYWTMSDGTPVASAAVTPSGSSTAWVLTDNTTILEYLANASVPTIDLQAYTISLHVLKDTDETRFPSFEINFLSGEKLSVQFNTKTGATWEYSKIGTPIHGVNDKGDWWEFWITALGGGLPSLFNIYPASGSVWQNISTNATGSFTAWAPAIIQGAVPYDPIGYKYKYAGPTDNFIPYTSPVILPPNYYAIMIYSPKSIDTNYLTALDLIIDVPDVNEYFEDVIVAATGLTAITLTKDFTEVTNVGITLQADGNGATVAVVVSKTAAEILIRTYAGEPILANQVQGLVDVRVQGY